VTGRLLTVAEVAKLLGVSTDTVKRRIQSGKLLAFRDERILRVRESDLRRYIAGMLTDADLPPVRASAAPRSARARRVGTPVRSRRSTVVRLWEE
jgi:excisionase family DNA binding protein